MPNVINEPFFDADEVREVCPICEDRFATGTAIGTRGRGKRATSSSFLRCDNPVCVQIANNSAGLKPIRRITSEEIRGFTIAALLR